MDDKISFENFLDKGDDCEGELNDENDYQSSYL
jgi:hypothetical protein